MIREITYRQLYLLVAAMLAITSCSSDDTFIHDGEKPMTFSVAAEQQTRATTYGDFTGENFGVEAKCYTGDYKEIYGIRHMPNVKVTYDDGSCATNGTYYWPDGNMHFAAYAPHYDNIESPMKITLPAKPYAGYKFDGTVDGKTNLMFANEQYGTVDAFTDGKVPILFNHALTQVRFRAKMADGTADDIKLTINSLKIKNIFNKGSIAFHHKDGDINQWNTDGMMWTVDESSSTPYDVVTEAIPNIGTTATACGNPLYLMPQQLTDNQKLEVTYTIGGNEKTATITLKDVGTSTIKEKWTVNKSVTYTLIMSSGNPVSLVVEVDKWIPVDFTHEFSNTVTINNDGKLRWVEGTYTSINDDKVVMLYDKTQPLKFKFNIAGPLGGTWLAMLITKTGEPDAFELSQTEGAVGQPAEISIRTTGDAVGVSNTAELRFLVRVGTTYLPVDALTTLSGERNYTIVQNIN